MRNNFKSSILAVHSRRLFSSQEMTERNSLQVIA